MYFFGRVRRTAKGFVSMNECNTLGYFCEVNGPVQGGVTASRNHNIFVAKGLGIFHHIHHAAAFEPNQISKLWFSRFEASQTCCNHHHFTMYLSVVGSGEHKAAIVLTVQPINSFPQCEGGSEWR